MTAKPGSETEEDGQPKINPYKLGTYDLVRLRINRLMEHPQAADEEFQRLREEKIKEFEARTAKKRQKRQKKKERRKRKKCENGAKQSEDSDETDDGIPSGENDVSEDKKEH
ncbi:unnamed protein product [Schistocephalus solidus]|uniref:PRKR-interacting protein 1 homolog n=1 Tax=Schistocephalus solidus TaxID=70667 RepID=A0A183TI69_SCHSO|nr:unnamed protein product [Schistocephalus solidus]